MVSVASLISILCALIAVSRGKEVSNGQTSDQVDSKWINYGRLGGFGLGSSWSSFSYYSGFNIGYTPWLYSWVNNLYGSCYGYALMPYMYNNMFFAKATEKHSISRRAITLDADQLSRRSSEATVNCIDDKGAITQFQKSDCLKAASKLADDKVSSATVSGCTLSLFSSKDRVAPKQISREALVKVADGILSACSTRRAAKRATTSSGNERDMVMLLSKPAPAN